MEAGGAVSQAGCRTGNGPEARKPLGFGCKPEPGVEPKGRTGQGSGEQGAKQQARTVDLGMGAVKAAIVTGEGKAVASDRSRPEGGKRRV